MYYKCLRRYPMLFFQDKRRLLQWIRRIYPITHMELYDWSHYSMCDKKSFFTKGSTSVKSDFAISRSSGFLSRLNLKVVNIFNYKFWWTCHLCLMSKISSLYEQKLIIWSNLFFLMLLIRLHVKFTLMIILILIL